MPTSDDSTLSVRYHDISYRDGYRVGDDGSVWSKVRRRCGDQVWYGEWKRCKPTAQSSYGHMLVFLGRNYCYFVHRLVLEAFVGLCPEGMQCRHLDGNPGNNRLENLAWGTPKENHADSVRHGTAFGESRRVIPKERIAGIQHEIAIGPRGTLTRLAKEWGISQPRMSQIARGFTRRTAS